MPGSYAHITVVNIASEKRSLVRIPDFPRAAIDAAGLNMNYLELGCISPDYPYLDVTSGDSKKWADAMHYTHTGPAIFAGAVGRSKEGSDYEEGLLMKTKKKKISDEEYYDRSGILGNIVDEEVFVSLDEELRKDIVAGKRKRKLRNITIKLDPLYLVSIKKVATMKGIPYQTLLRQWVAENIRKELKIA